jgi:hypothetical protein
MEEENIKEGDWGKKLRRKEIEGMKKWWKDKKRKREERQSRGYILLSAEVSFTITFVSSFISFLTDI